MGNRSARGTRPARGPRGRGGQGFQVGRGNTQYNLFVGTPPQGPVVAGSIPQAPQAFQPREDLMARLRAAGPGVSVVRAVTGMRGVGKTQLAAAYARECVDRGWRLVAWINAEDDPGILNGLAAVAQRLGMDKPGALLGAIAAEVRNRLEADGRDCLLVFDNVLSLEAVRPYLPAAGKAQVVVTSTDTTTRALGKAVGVEVFTDEESLDFLAERTERADPDGARSLADELGHLPLALAQAAAVISAQRLDYQTYLGRLRGYPVRDYLRPSPDDPYPHGVAEAILLSIDAVTGGDQADLNRDLLLLVALLSPDGVSRDLLHLAASTGAITEARRSRVAFLKRGQGDGATPEAVDAALGRLADASLLTYNSSEASGGPLVTAHRLVRRVVRERGDHAPRRDAAALRICTTLAAACGAVNDTQQQRAAARELVRHIVTLNDYLGSRPRAASQALTGAMRAQRVWALSTLVALGDSPAETIDFGEPLVEDCGRMLGTWHPDTIRARADLAWAYNVVNRTDEAILLLERVLEDGIRVLGIDHPSTMGFRSLLADAYTRGRRVDEAVPLYEVNLASRERLHGASHRSTLMAQSSLGWVYKEADRLDEAVPLLEQTLASQVALLGDEHVDTLYTRDFLASAYRDAGRLSDAASLFEHTAPAMARALGDEHPVTLILRGNLAGTYAAAGRVREAIPLYEQALSGLQRVLGEEHQDTCAVRDQLASLRPQARSKRLRRR